MIIDASFEHRNVAVAPMSVGVENLPIGIVAVYFFAREICNGPNNRCIKWNYALTISFFFVEACGLIEYSANQSFFIKIFIFL